MSTPDSHAVPLQDQGFSHVITLRAAFAPGVPLLSEVWFLASPSKGLSQLIWSLTPYTQPLRFCSSLRGTGVMCQEAARGGDHWSLKAGVQLA